MIQLVRFLGGLPLALFLILSILIFVGTATFIESKFDSHQLASSLIYAHPLFKILLWGCGVNILFATIRRYPFRKKHIPFLCAHLGLLMILSGTLIKNYFGMQATFMLTEGCSTSSAMIPGSYAINLETREKGIWKHISIPIKKNHIGKISTPFPLTITEWIPHSEENFEGFFKGNRIVLWGHPPFSVSSFKSEELPLIGASFCIEDESDEVWDLYAFYNNDMKSIITQCYHHSLIMRKTPALIFIHNGKEEWIIALHSKSEPFATNLSLESPKEFLLFDKGYQGYGLFVSLPDTFSKFHKQIELITPLSTLAKDLPIPLKKEEATPRLNLLVDSQRPISLNYSQFGTSFYWPLQPGQWIGYFGCQKIALPCEIRLRKARKIDYPSSQQPFSYECDVIIKEKNMEKEISLSMNKVYQTRGGTRFYLANLFIPNGKLGAKKAQFIVNHDPARSFLTYPGGIILSIGIVLLFCKKRSS